MQLKIPAYIIKNDSLLIKLKKIKAFWAFKYGGSGVKYLHFCYYFCGLIMKTNRPFNIDWKICQRQPNEACT